jgi:hypothetical protein
VGTSEVSVTALHAGEILDLDPDGDGSVERGIAALLDKFPSVRGARKLLWIEWSAVDSTQGVSLGHYREVLQFVIQELGACCPDTVRVLVLLPVVISAKGGERVAAYLNNSELLSGSPATGFRALTRLGSVDLSEIVDHLDKHSSCPHDLTQAVARVLLAVTGGRWTELVAELDAVEDSRTTWAEHAARLPETPQTPAAFDEDEVPQ